MSAILTIISRFGNTAIIYSIHIVIVLLESPCLVYVLLCSKQTIYQNVVFKYFQYGVSLKQLIIFKCLVIALSRLC